MPEKKPSPRKTSLFIGDKADKIVAVGNDNQIGRFSLRLT